jgi:hypothetical protein
VAFGPDNFNVTVKLGTVFCFQGQDTTALLGGPESEPYLWMVGFKVDGTSLIQNGNFLTGQLGMFVSQGSHRNLTNGIVSAQSVRVRPEVGEWNTEIKPIPISVAGQQITRIPAMVGLVAVLMEENLTPGGAVDAALQAVVKLIKDTVQSVLASMGLAGIAADSVAAVAAAGGPGRLSLDAAVQQVVKARLKPVEDLFTMAAGATAAIAFLQKVGIDGIIGTAIDSDMPMGVFTKMWSQSELAMTTSDERKIELHEHLWNMPRWAYSVHGDVWAHHRYVRIGPPASHRLEVMCSSKRMLIDGPRISTIGGLDNGTAWQLGRQEAADLINRGEKEFFTRSPDGTEAQVEAVQGGFVNGRPWHFLQTAADQIEANNLKDLPDCSAAGLYQEQWY